MEVDEGTGTGEATQSANTGDPIITKTNTGRSAMRTPKHDSSAVEVTPGVARAREETAAAMAAMMDDSVMGDRNFELPEDLDSFDGKLPMDDPRKRCYFELKFDETYEDEAPVFAYNSIVAFGCAVFENVEGVWFHANQGTNLPDITSMKEFPPNMSTLTKYTVRPNPWWIGQFAKRRKEVAEGIKLEIPKPKKQEERKAR